MGVCIGGSGKSGEGDIKGITGGGEVSERSLAPFPTPGREAFGSSLQHGDNWACPAGLIPHERCMLRDSPTEEGNN